MRLARRRERLLDADVQLLRAGAEPAAAAGPERLGLRQLLHPEQAAVERPRRLLASGRGGDLHVVDPEDRHAPKLYHRSWRFELEDTLVGGLPPLAAETPRRRIDIELRVLDVLFAAVFGLLLLPVGAVIALAILLVRAAAPSSTAASGSGAAAHFFTMLKFRTLERDAETRLGPYLGEELVAADRGRVHAHRPLAEGVAARRDPAALERPSRRHVVRRAAPDPGALLRRARARAAGVLAALVVRPG